MTHAAKAIVVVCLPLAACAPSKRDQPERSSDPSSVEDRRPSAGIGSGDDITELVRMQNEPGSEPPLPTRKGSVSRITAGLFTKKMKKGFITALPASRSVPTPAFHRGKLFAGGFGTWEFHAINAKTGKAAWSLRLSDDGPTDAACQDGMCVFNTYSCTIFNVDADTGRELWSWYLGSPQLATPVIAGDTVYTSYPASGRAEGSNFVLAALDLETGAMRWQRWMDAEVNSTPVAHAGRVYVATRAGTLYELGADDGKVISVRKNRIASPPVLADGVVLFGRDELLADNDMLVTSRPLFPGLEPVQPPTREAVRPRPRPLVARHRLITVDRGNIVATHRGTGQRLWQHRFEGEVPAEISAPLLHAGPSLLLATSAGNILQMDPDTGDVTGIFKMGAGPIASQPIAVNGWLYAGTIAGTIVGHDTGNGELTGWEMLGGGPDRRGTLDPEGT